MRVNFIEYDKKCANLYQKKINDMGINVFVGDQSNKVFLEEVMHAQKSKGGLFNIVIDDGGHYNSQIIASLETLWQSVAPGGYYFVEDYSEATLFSYDMMPGLHKQSDNAASSTFIGKVVALGSKLVAGGPVDLAKLGFIECRRASGICLLHKADK